MALTATIIIAMAADPEFKLKDWQPLMAAVIAFVGGVGAYKAATSKTDLEREVIASDLRKRKLATFLKVDAAIEELGARARMIDASFSFPPERGTRSYDADDVALKVPTELDEAWSNIDIFPQSTIREIFSLKRNTKILRELTAPMEPGDAYEVTWAPRLAPPWSTIQELAEAIWKSCAVINAALAPEIAKLAPEMNHNEKMLTIHGTPDWEP